MYIVQYLYYAAAVVQLSIGTDAAVIAQSPIYIGAAAGYHATEAVVEDGIELLSGMCNC